MFLTVFFLLLGLGILILAADFLVKGAASLAKRWGIPPIVIGLTVVAFGTSAPELVVNLFAAFRGSADIAIGNIVGSNIANIFLILGLSAAIYPLSVKSNTIWKEIPLALLAIALIFIMGNDSFLDGAGFNALTRTDGLALIALFVIFLYYIVSLSRAEPPPAEEIKEKNLLISLAFTVAGLLGLFLGGKLLIDSAVILARLGGLSESLIGLTVVAVGTSLPELATSVVAALRKHTDIAVGNVVGSNIFNVFWILGLTSTILPLPFNLSANFDVLIALIAALLLFVFMFIGRRHVLQRSQGITFVIIYLSYISYLIIRG